MMYEQSSTIEQIMAKHPFPWQEQRMNQFVRMVDAKGIEVVMFEITALAMLMTRKIAAEKS